MVLTNDSVFPTELEREIFETTALMHPDSMPTLLRVAYRVLLWVPALLTAMESKPPAFFCGVRHIMLKTWYGIFTQEDAQRLLKLCTKLTSFACDDWDGERGLILPLVAELHPQRLLVPPDHFHGSAGLDLTHSPFNSVTHLELLWKNGYHVSESDVLDRLATLPALTHLAVYRGIPRERLLVLLDQCPRLMLLMVIWHKRAWGAELQIPHVYDGRFVILPVRSYASRWTEWLASANGLFDSWSRADEFVARKRRGEIEASRYWLD
ncbi:hypothetical protein DFH06DRAFT_1139264 [Mycena polygramma]|nr:hypothetical protein DFH06DRAFT_1139264 [Mycena polygramma]